MTIQQIEKFYSAFYPKQWRKRKLTTTNEQTESGAETAYFAYVLRPTLAGSFRDLSWRRIPELLVLDDFSLGLDPGYRRLFVDYLRDYARSENKTVFLTSHIIQDMERLIDDCIIMDYGHILIQQPIKELLDTYAAIPARCPKGYRLPEIQTFSTIRLVITQYAGNLTHSCLNSRKRKLICRSLQTPYSNLKCETVNLEDAFFGLRLCVSDYCEQEVCFYFTIHLYPNS